MEQNEKMNGATVSMGDLFKALFSKIKLIVCITILGAILGAAMSMFDVSYAATARYYVSSFDDSDALLYDLDSARFAERILLDKNGLPEKSTCDPEDYKAALDAINAANSIHRQRIEHADKMSVFDIENNYSSRREQLVEKVNMLQKLVDSYNPDFPTEVTQDPERMAIVAEYDKKLAEAVEDLEEFEAGLQKEWEAMETVRARLNKQWRDALEVAEDAREVLLIEWRKSPEVSAKISAIKSSLVYEYSAGEWLSEKSDSTVREQTSVNKKYINVYIVSENEDLVSEILDKLEVIFPTYVEGFISDTTGALEPECKLMSTVAGVSETSGFLRAGTVKSAILYAVVAFALSVVAVIAVYLAVQSGVISLKPKRKSKKAESCDKPESKS